MEDEVGEFRRALGQFATGVAIISATGPRGGPIGLTVSSFNSVSLRPPLVLFSVARSAGSLPALSAARGYAVNVLSEDQEQLSNRFARPQEDKWHEVRHAPGVVLAPVIEDALACFECEPYAQYDGGDHVIFVVVWSGSVAGRRAGRSCSFAAVTAAFASSGPRNGRCPFTISQNLAPKPETIIMLKTGKQHIESLRDGRTVYLHGKRIEDTTIHPAFRNAVRSVADLYDFQCRSENRELMTFPTESGPANRIWELPESYGQLRERRRALEAWNGLHGGFLGRAPDHVASCIAGMYMGLEVFDAYDRKRAAALADYYRFARDNNLYLTYVIINPQADRSKSASQQRSEYLTAGVAKHDASGITVRGAKMLATGATMANEVFVTCIQPLQSGDEKYAISFAIPLNSKGTKILSRKSYEETAPQQFDSPLSHRFDENDAVLFFDDVEVPWERVFVFDSIEMCQKQFHATPAHVYQNYQSIVRLSVKMRFLAGIGRRISEINGIGGFPQVREILGQLAAEAAMVDALVEAMEAKGTMHGRYFIPDRHTLYAAQTLTQQLYPRVLNTLRELAGGGMITLPSSVQDFENPEVADLIEKTQQSPAANATDKVKFYKLAWDAVGSEFASRHQQYEMFYAGASFVVKNHSFRTYDWAAAGALVDRMLSSYSLEDELGRPQSAVA